LQPFDVSDFGAGTMGLNLPIAFRDPLGFKDDSQPRSFCHEAEYAPTGQGGKP